MDKDIIWITYRGRKIPIKPGMKGKFNKKRYEELKNKKIRKESSNKVEESNEKINEEDRKSIDSKLKDYEQKLASVKEKINKMRSEDEEYMDYEGRKIKVTGLNTDYTNPKNNIAYGEEKYYEKEIDKMKKVSKSNSLSDYEQYFISLGYSKATALKMAKEEINRRKK